MHSHPGLFQQIKSFTLQSKVTCYTVFLIFFFLNSVSGAFDTLLNMPDYLTKGSVVSVTGLKSWLNFIFFHYFPLTNKAKLMSDAPRFEKINFNEIYMII